MTNRSGTLANHRGQSLIVAIAALFMLMFIAGIFIAMVGQNLTRAGRGSDVVGAQALAEAGVRYADYMLTYSPDGADWRPAPPGTVDVNDPDQTYLANGYSRFPFGNGRFLLKITFGDGSDDDPLSRCIKIESIGRVGLIDPNDPTTFQNSQPVRLRRELVAYKPIGITDYLIFVTNKDRDPNPATLGIPATSPSVPFDPNDKNLCFWSEYTGPIRVNGNLEWVGYNRIHLNRRVGGEGTYRPDLAPVEFPAGRYSDAIEVAGDITHWQSPASSGGSPDTIVQLEDPNRNGGAYADAFPSADPNYTTDPFQADGNLLPIYRDGRPASDKNGKARWIKRLEPPLIDARNPQTGVSRYIALTKLSGVQNSNGTNSGQFGLGEGIYIDNFRDIQANHGDLRREWLTPGASNSAWVVDRYVPPGISVVFYGGGLMEITRNTLWRMADGQQSTVYTRYYKLYRDPGTGRAMYVVLDANRGFEEINETRSPFNGVLYAEGNIRVRGKLPDGIAMTMVSGGSIYIEGNIIKGASISINGVNYRSGVGLLAKDYVCVNTTQFFRVEGNLAGTEYYTVSTGEGYFLHGSVGFGIDPGLYPVINSGPSVFLLISHKKSANQPVGAWMATGVGMRPAPPPAPVIDLSGGLNDQWRRQVLPFWGGTGQTWAVDAAPGGSTAYEIQTAATNVPQYYVQRIGIQPLDIRIEALMYAQEKCFFVIPGKWFNPDSGDTRASFASSKRRPDGVDWEFPFFEEPLDVRIWVNGAISENRTASTAEMAEWCRKWGWTPTIIGPDVPGPTGNPPIQGAHKGIGLTFVYDSELRKGAAGDPFPPLPKLPVSPDLIFFGNKIQ